MKNPRYEIQEVIGEGGAGVVARAYDRTLHRMVAIKRIKACQRSQESKAAALTEAKALSSMQHPHIVTVYDVGHDDDGYFIVMELINGENLEKLARLGKMLIQQFVPFCVQVQEALIGAHGMDVLHRDLKPANVMLQWLPSGNPHVKLLDFGLADLKAGASGKSPHSTSLIGSLHFMSPEQFEKRDLTATSDIYAAGCLYYYALTRHFPFDGDDAIQVMSAHLTHRVLPLAKLRPDLPAWLCDWIMWHIQRDSAARPQSVLDAMDAFNATLWKQSGWLR